MVSAARDRHTDARNTPEEPAAGRAQFYPRRDKQTDVSPGNTFEKFHGGLNDSARLTRSQTLLFRLAGYVLLLGVNKLLQLS